MFRVVIYNCNVSDIASYGRQIFCTCEVVAIQCNEVCTINNLPRSSHRLKSNFKTVTNKSGRQKRSCLERMRPTRPMAKSADDETDPMANQNGDTSLAYNPGNSSVTAWSSENSRMPDPCNIQTFRQ